MGDLRGALRLAVTELREMAGIARAPADTMAADLALHMMRLARGPRRRYRAGADRDRPGRVGRSAGLAARRARVAPAAAAAGKGEASANARKSTSGHLSPPIDPRPPTG